ncbi:MAG: hypothetical protein QOI96_1868 [Verrucomicrobiota bacterium]|jgi:hypothetical protein
MSKSYYPTDRKGQIDWHKNFAAEFPKVGESFGFTAVEIASAVNDSSYAVYLLETLGPEIESDPTHIAHAVLEGQSQGSYVDLPSASNGPPAVHPGIDTRRQARVERIKASPAFTFDVIGKQLKIVGGKFDPKNYKAELGQARQTGPNTVVIPFRKAGGEVAGINLYRQRKDEAAPTLVNFFKRTPAVDPLPPAAPGKPEQRTYTARAVINGKEIGQASDPVGVTMK